MTFEKKSSYSYEEIITCAKGDMFGRGNPQLPMPPMLMFDRITHVSEDGGAHGKGQIVAEFDIKPDLWFFECHFEGDPVMPGCLGLDALWQLTGFYLGWLGGKGSGRALGVGEIKFSDMILPENKLVTYTIDFKRVVNGRLVLGTADGTVNCDGKDIYTAKDLKVGLFENKRLK